ncbi:hypothetical protein BS333_10370 [Vibrio azureus]|uniref:KfrA N-terminal DNA-binding domain-containing protein n=1 Tax=Vibrio azureus NBRC 104587 TaxID=1219077 RepID=U3A393_9VIBR|nr:hypothetical protein [Vibrio azureus]AUI86762.1 hypothetical protein BS333_10370 [Vibrio azureus]GAD74466.1 hypothetical protein VAZ01S_010_01190 [Vibrio azureus NBRC 104587]
MLTQDVTHELETVMTQLQQQGKEPTVALVKARLKTTIPMPALITAIKSWKNAQRVPKVEVAQPNSTEQDRLAQLEATVASLMIRIEKLEAQLNEKAS